MPTLLAFTQSSFDPASRFRFIQFIPHLQRAGWQVDHRPNRPDRQWSSSLRPRLVRALHYRAGRCLMKANRLRDVAAARHCHLVFMNRDLAAEGPFLRHCFAPAIRKAVYDFDDAIFAGPHEALVRWTCSNAAWITPGNQYLAAYARQFSRRVTVIPTVVDTDRYIPRNYETPPPNGHVRVGWTGSESSFRATLAPHLDMLRQLQRTVPFELVLITTAKPQLPLDLRCTFIPWKPEEESQLANCFDIGIMPLLDVPFQRGKCGCKLLQYMAAGLPTVASPVGVNSQIVRHQVTGVLASSDAEWHLALERLIRDYPLRAAFGQAGRRRCEAHYSIRAWLPVLLEIFNRLAQPSR